VIDLFKKAMISLFSQNESVTDDDWSDSFILERERRYKSVGGRIRWANVWWSFFYGSEKYGLTSDCMEWLRIPSNLSHERTLFLNPLDRGEARVFARSSRSDSGFPSCYAWFQNGVPPRKDSGFEGGADICTKPNKNWLDWSENIQRKFEGIRTLSSHWTFSPSEWWLSFIQFHVTEQSRSILKEAIENIRFSKLWSNQKNFIWLKSRDLKTIEKGLYMGRSNSGRFCERVLSGRLNDSIVKGELCRWCWTWVEAARVCVQCRGSALQHSFEIPLDLARKVQNES
jgi:hypothetical protein